MIERIIDWCAGNRFLVFTGTAVLTLGSIWAVTATPLDAVPDISDVQVIVSTEWSGRSPDLIEDQITYPIVTTLISTPQVRTVRGFTDFGISYVYVIFEDGTDMYWARSRVVEYLQGIRGQLPEGVNPVIGPDATGVGWVFEYALVDETGQHDLAELRGFQDWYLRYWLASVPGVAEVASIGGFVKQYQVNVDPNKLAAYNLSIRDVVRAIKASNSEVEGRLLEFAGREYMVRGRGYLQSIDDIEQISLGTDDRGTPIRVVDVAQVRLGPDIRRGVAELDGRGEVVGGIVVMRFGENALRVIERVKAKLEAVQGSLPSGVTIVPTYDRSHLINQSIGTLRRTLIEEAVVVSLVIILFLFHVRSALITILVLPIAVVASFIPIYYLGVNANIMSLGGIALAIGVLVDASIVMVENAYRHASEPDTHEPGTSGQEPEGATHERRHPTVRYEDQPQVVIRSAKQIGRAIFFSLAIIIISFLPVFLLEAQEGRMFRPLAFTKTSAMIFASILSITLVPVLMTIFIRGKRLRPESQNPVSRFFTWLYDPILRLVLRWRWAALVINFAVVPLTVPLLLTIGSEFMPPLYEGSMLYMPTAPPGLSIGESTRLLQVQDRLLKQFPEVERVFGTVGRATTSTDNSPMGMVNTTLTLKPKDQWRPGLTLERLQVEMDQVLQFPGFPNVWTQPIRNRLDMLLTGIKTPVGIKIFGSDLNVIQRLGEQIERIAQDVPGTRSVYAERVAQGYFADIRVDREAIARYGLTIEDVQDVIQSALGGRNVTRTIEGRERYPVSVRYARDFRENLPAIERVLVKTPTGSQIPLGQLAGIRLTPGPAMVRDEDGQLAGYDLRRHGHARPRGLRGTAEAGHRRPTRSTTGLHLVLDRPVRVPGAGAGAPADHDAGCLLRHLHATSTSTRARETRGTAEAGHRRPTRSTTGLHLVLDRPVRVPGAGAGAPADHDAGCLLRHLHAAVHDVQVGLGSGDRTAVGRLRDDRRRHLAVVAWLQLLGRRVGRLHRALRGCGSDGRRHDDLPARGARPAASPGRRDHRARRLAGYHRRLGPTASAQAHDGYGGHGLLDSDYVEHRRRLGCHEADRRADYRGHGDVDDPRAD